MKTCWKWVGTWGTAVKKGMERVMNRWAWTGCLLAWFCCYCGAQEPRLVAGCPAMDAYDDVFKDQSLYWGEGVISHAGTPIVGMRAAYSSGAAQSDIRTLTYEDGSPLIEQGYLYYSMTSRTAGAGLCIYRLLLGTGKLELCGIIRGRVVEAGQEPAFWRVAAGHIMYDRKRSQWQLCMSCHAGEVANRQPRLHRLYAASSLPDVRFGAVTIDFTPLDYEGAAVGDEDGQIFYDADLQRWILIYASTHLPDGKEAPHYVLRLQTSQRPDGGFRGSTCATDLSATGITTSCIGGIRYVLSGDNAQDGQNVYRAYTYALQQGQVVFQAAGRLDIDLTDGGFRGWNNVTPIPEGPRTRYVLLTFDRMRATDESNWTYGNLYLYYSAETNAGQEFAVYDRAGQLVQPANIHPQEATTVSLTQLHFRRMATLHPLFDELPLAEIDLSMPALAPHGNRYPCVIGQVRQCGRELRTEGEACVLGGTHQAMANYLLPLTQIAEGDSRYLYIGNAEGKAHYKVLATRRATDIEITLQDASTQEGKPVCTVPTDTPYVRLAFTIPTSTHSTPYRLYVFYR